MTHSDRRPVRPLPGLAGVPIDTAQALVVCDCEGRITGWSGAAQELWGYSPEEIIGRPLTELFGTADAAVRHQDGRLLQVGVRLAAFPTGDKPGGYLVLAEGGDEQLGDEALLRLMFDQHPATLVILDGDGRTVRLNQAAARAAGVTEEQVRGRRITEDFRGPVYSETEQRVRRVAVTGAAEQVETFLALPGEETAHAWVSDAFPLKDASGRVRAVGLAAYDYSQQFASRERLALLGESRARIGTSLELEGTVQELADVVVPRFADAVSVDLLEAVFEGELPRPVRSGPLLLRRAGSRSGTASTWRHPAPGAAAWYPPSSFLTTCVATGRAEMHQLTDAEYACWSVSDPTLAEQARAFRAHSLIAVPIHARGTTLGVALFLRHGPARKPFTPDDLTVAEDLVARVALCLDNARQFIRERSIALTLQRTLLPQGPAVHPAAETAARYVPAGLGSGVGGDWFDVIPLPGARIGLVVGDVVGHGIDASATMGRLRTAVRTLADLDLAPDELLTHLDDIVTHGADEADACGGRTGVIPGDVGAGCLYAVYDPVAGTCSLARAGNPPPVLVHPDGSVHLIDAPAGPPLGLGSLPFEATECAIPEGSLLVLFTDGLIEDRHHDLEYGLDKLYRTVSKSAPSLNALCDTLLDACRTPDQSDDICLLIARTRILDPEHVADWDVPEDGAAVAEIRRLVGERLATWGMEEAAFTMELVVSELVTNAIRYATTPIHLRLIKEECLICEVSDGSSTAPHLRRARLSDEGGRGLFLVDQLTQRWGTRYSPRGKTIWVEQTRNP
ncbi:PAS/PAC sensor protein [Streptomyces rimosus subsp. pseudoverticillatus]|uniref:SpoIIE family protein phosphatase n=1 Tax=Streptomyces rimosus TaxID=1927 RepID=UPI0006B26635|nr:SpoIIE family protein phosphatase [Streptomyces rimosus]KOT92805.1 PAS/PAC sensor protein [Streptomyces rimosus subsp. pseudoverticillatus]